MKVEAFEREDIGYLNEALIKDNILQVLPCEYFNHIPPNHIKQFCVEQGVYCLPTRELIEFLRKEIGPTKDKTIEIGAGHGAIGRELDIVATDSMMQLDPEINRLYNSIGQAPVNYGKNVLKYDAEAAIRKYHPQCVVAAWVTHKFNPQQPYREGNMFGVKEQWILSRVNKYIFIGNTRTHMWKPILDQPHITIEPDWLVSRTYQRPGYTDIIWIWEGRGED